MGKAATLLVCSAIVLPSVAGGMGNARAEQAPPIAEVLSIVGGQVAEITPIEPQDAMDGASHGYRLDLKPVLNSYGDCWSQRIEVKVSAPARTFGYPPLTSKFRELRVINRFRPAHPTASGLVCDDVLKVRWTTADDEWRYHAAKRALDEIEAYIAQADGRRGKAPFVVNCQEFGRPCADNLEGLRRAFQLGVDHVGLADETVFSDKVVIEADHLPAFEPNWRLSAKLEVGGHVSAVDIDFTAGPMP